MLPRMVDRRWWLGAGLVAAACGGDDGRQGASSSASGITITGGIDSGDGIGDIGDDTGDKLDVGGGSNATAGGGDCPGGGGGGGMGGAEFALIWIANSPEGTVSKIDTATGVELARYYTGPGQGTDDPSRTSVNLAGDVAVSNRGGGLAKIAAQPSGCVDGNGNGTIETSTGPGDVLAWGDDECVLWHQDTSVVSDNRLGPRPTAWDAGAANNPCEPQDDRLWVGWYEPAGDFARFRRLDGGSGVTLDEVDIADWRMPASNQNYGPYGGAVNGEGDLWTIGLWGPLAKIDGETLTAQKWDVPDGSDPYGIAVDAEGHVWTAGWNGTILHFDPNTETFDSIAVAGGRRMRGLMVDREGFAWIAANDPCGVVKVDTATVSLLDDAIALPGCSEPVGVSIDVDGNVWLPDRDTGSAYKLDPVTLMSTQTTGLVGPYTYSDMTGAGLGLVTNPPTG
jgi:DNA-binding beta-propeller fold protein YncE